MQTLKNPLLKTLLPINVAQSPNIKRKSQVDGTKTFLICEKHCFEKNAFKVGEYNFTQFFCNWLETVYQKKIYLVSKYI